MLVYYIIIAYIARLWKLCEFCCSFIDLDDFDNAVIRITFDSDENTPDNERTAPIAVVNDIVNEADEQVFIVHLRLLNSTNPDGVDLSIRPASLCKIVNHNNINRKSNNVLIISNLMVVYIV